MKNLISLIISPLFFLFLNFQAEAKETLFINEIIASNTTGITDGTGSREDWFEIYNPNDYQIDLAGYYISDNAASPTKFQVPSGANSPKIPAHGFIIMWASSHPERGSTHTTFGLSNGGEDLVIYSPAQEFIDGISFGQQTANISFGRQQDGGSSWVYFSTTTPGATNASGVILQKLGPPQFSEPAGFRSAEFSLSLTHPEPGVSIRYTLDPSPLKARPLKRGNTKTATMTREAIQVQAVSEPTFPRIRIPHCCTLHPYQ